MKNFSAKKRAALPPVFSPKFKVKKKGQLFPLFLTQNLQIRIGKKFCAKKLGSISSCFAVEWVKTNSAKKKGVPGFALENRKHRTDPIFQTDDLDRKQRMGRIFLPASNGLKFFCQDRKHRMDQIFFFFKKASISPCFGPPKKKKTEARLRACPRSHQRRIMIRWCSPPALPLPAPIQATDFWVCPCQGWGRVRARAGLVLGMITPPSPPLPPVPFFFGVAPREGGEKEALRYPDLPRRLPHLSTQVPCTLLAQHGYPGQTGGGGGRYRVPTPTLPPTNLT